MSRRRILGGAVAPEGVSRQGSGLRRAPNGGQAEYEARVVLEEPEPASPSRVGVSWAGAADATRTLAHVGGSPLSVGPRQLNRFASELERRQSNVERGAAGRQRTMRASASGADGILLRQWCARLAEEGVASRLSSPLRSQLLQGSVSASPPQQLQVKPHGPAQRRAEGELPGMAI